MYFYKVDGNKALAKILLKIAYKYGIERSPGICGTELNSLTITDEYSGYIGYFPQSKRVSMYRPTADVHSIHQLNLLEFIAELKK
jgi:hypothetical protein